MPQRPGQRRHTTCGVPRWRNGPCPRPPDCRSCSLWVLSVSSPAWLCDLRPFLAGVRDSVGPGRLGLSQGPRPVTGLEVLTVHQAPRAGLQQGTPEHADIVQAAVTRMRVVTKFFRTSEVSFLKEYSWNNSRHVITVTIS